MKDFNHPEMIRISKGNIIYPIWLKHFELKNELKVACGIKSKKKNARRFKLRAELIEDVMEYIKRQPKSIWNIKIETGKKFPDAKFKFTFNLKSL